MEGRHLFSRFALTFRIDPIDGTHCRVRAESSAEFPGPGTVYRALVVAPGATSSVSGILRQIKGRAERSGASSEI